MSETDGLIWACRVDPSGHGTDIGWADLDRDHAEGIHGGGFQWVHLDLAVPTARQWVREKSGLADVQVEALLAEETRPRSTPMGKGVVLILRGVNLNAGADPEDMVAVRLWVEAGRVITVRRRRLLAFQELHEQLIAGQGANNVGAFVADVARRLVERMAGVVGELDEQLDSIEEESEDSMGEKRVELAELRRQAIRLRRYLSPQRDALSRLAAERVDWLGDLERLEIREVLDRTTRYVEDLEAARERAAVTQEEFSNRLAEELNRRMYALSIVAGVFLPLSFATGLLGINVGGIPGAETPLGFAAVCFILGLLAVGEVLIFRRLRWL